MTFEKLHADMVAAMKARDKERKNVISTLIADVKKAAIDAETREDIPEELVDKVILKSLKTAKEQVDTCPDDRVELKADYQYNYDVISEYAPKMMAEHFSDTCRVSLKAIGHEIRHQITKQLCRLIC